MNQSHFLPYERVIKIELEQVLEKSDCTALIHGSEGTQFSLAVRELIHSSNMVSEFLLTEHEFGKHKSVTLYVGLS